LGYLYTQNGELAKAEFYLKMAGHLSDSLSSLELQRDHTRFFYELYEQIGKNKEALQYFKKHVQIRDSLINTEKIRENSKIEWNFLVEKIRIEQAAKDELKEIEIRAEKSKRFNYGIIVVLLLVLLVTTIILYKINSDRNRLLELENHTMREEIKSLWNQALNSLSPSRNLVSNC